MLAASGGSALSQKKYGPGVTDTEIKIGRLMPTAGPLSAFGTIGRDRGGYFDKINAEGGINGRKINFIILDDGYSPPKTVEQTRRLVEQREVCCCSARSARRPTSAIKYINAKKVPQLFLATGATKWGDRRTFRGPWAVSRTTRARDGLCAVSC